MAFRVLQEPTGSATGSSLRPLDTAPSTTTPKKSLFAGIKEDFSKRIKNVATSKKAAISGEQSHAEGFFQTMGQTAAFAGDVATRVLGKAASTVTPDVIEEPIKKATRSGMEKLVSTAPVQKTMQKYQEVKAEHPRAAKNIESGLNILSVIPQAKATQVGIKTAVNTTKTAVKPVLKAVDKAGDALGDLPRRMEQTNLRLTPVQKQTLGKKLNEVTQFIADEEIIGDQGKKFQHVSKITDDMETKLQKHLTEDLGDPEIPVSELREQIRALKESPEFKNERDLPLIYKQIDSMDHRLSLYGENIKLSDLNQLKRSTYKEAYNKAGDKIADWVEHDLADIFKTKIEEVSNTSGKSIDGMDVKAFNQRYGTAISARKLLKISQTRPQIGLVGKIAGTLMGGTVGTAIGGPAGAAVGLYVGPKVGEVIGGSTARSLIGVGAKKLKKIEPSAGLSTKAVDGIPKAITPELVGKKMDKTDVKILETYMKNPRDMEAGMRAMRLLDQMGIGEADRDVLKGFLEEAMAIARDRFTKRIFVKEER